MDTIRGRPSRYTKEQKELARKLFSELKDRVTIAKETGVHVKTVDRWAQMWKTDTDAEIKDYIAVRLKKASKGVSQIIEMSVPLVAKSIEARFRQAFTPDGQPVAPLDMKEMEQLTGIISNLDKLLMKYVTPSPEKLMQIEDESVQPKSIKDLHDAIAKDKFLNWDEIRRKNAEYIAVIGEPQNRLEDDPYEGKRGELSDEEFWGPNGKPQDA
jgi:transposase